MKRTETMIRIAVAMLDDPFGRHWGYDLSRKAHVRSGVMYPALRRMLDAGWLTDGWEDTSEVEGRPPRRYYTLTGTGQVELRQLIETVPAGLSAALGGLS